VVPGVDGRPALSHGLYICRTAHLLVVALVAASICAVGAPIAGAAPLTGNGKIAFVDTSTYSPSIGLINADGSGRRQLTHTLPVMGEPAWSPDGRRIAFVLADRIALMRPNGEGVRQLDRATFGESAPRWSPTGELAFLRARGPAYEDGWNLVVARSDGSGQRVITIPEGVKFPEDFAWSKDGQRVAWMASRSGGFLNTLVSVEVTSGEVRTDHRKTSCQAPPAPAPHGPLSVCAVSPYGLVVVKLLRGDALARAIGFPGDSTGEVQPVWNPQGTKIAYGVEFNRLAVYTLATRRTRTYIVPARDTGADATFSWSPDGHALVVGANSSKGSSIAVLDLRTGIRSTILAHTEDLAPGFSPDGNLLAYIHIPADGPAELRVIRGLESPSTIIMRGVASGLMRPYGWAPDSKSLAFTTATWKIIVVGHGKQSVHTLVEGAAGPPFWSPDGSTIAFVRDLYGPIEFVRADGSPSPIATLPGYSAMLGWTPDGKGLFVTGRDPAQATIISIAGGSPTATFGLGALGSTLSPDGSSALLAALQPPHLEGPFAISVEHLTGAAAGIGPISEAPAVWSPDGTRVIFSPGLEAWRDGYYDERAAHTIAIEPAANPTALAAAIPDASAPTWQPRPAG
jgi:Tol biopolymer transport system component